MQLVSHLFSSSAICVYFCFWLNSGASLTSIFISLKSSMTWRYRSISSTVSFFVVHPRYNTLLCVLIYCHSWHMAKPVFCLYSVYQFLLLQYFSFPVRAGTDHGRVLFCTPSRWVLVAARTRLVTQFSYTITTSALVYTVQWRARLRLLMCLAR